jgi:hypothetical protein
MRWGWRTRLLLGVLGLLSSVARPGAAHHGGLGIEGDLVAWSLKVDQWQQEAFTHGYRVKFLAHPRTAMARSTTRLVFEVQSAATGRYVSGLAPEVHIRAPQHGEYRLTASETPGVTAYYEVPFVFPTAGQYVITFRAQRHGQELTAAFAQRASPHPLLGDWTIMVGNGALLAASLATWIGAVLALQRRLMGGSVGG